METYVEKDLFEGAKFICCPVKRFKSTRITVRFVLKMNRDKVSAYAALPGLIRYTSRRYPETIAMERKLASLYGAGFSAVASKAGDLQVLSFTLSTVADKFAFAGEKISEECLSFLLDCILSPDLDENGLFKAQNIAREKRLMIEDIKASQSDKMAYSLNRFNELFYEGEGAAVLSTGTVEQVQALTAAQITSAWHEMLQTASIYVCAVGDWDTQAVEQVICERFAQVQRQWDKAENVPHKAHKQLVKNHEVQPLEQCKLTMGFCVGSEDEAALKVMNTIFGRSEMSRLSKVVREKMSLCYYCSSVYGPKKKVLIVYSGVESENREKTVHAVLKQLEEIQNGNFSNEEMNIAKRKMIDSYRSSFDTPSDLAQWYLLQMMNESVKTVGQCITETEEVTRERIVDCAKTVTPDCVYTLGEDV